MNIADEILVKKWEEMEDVPFDEVDGELILAEDYWIFNKGTTREDIWEYFDVHYSKGVHWLLYEKE